MKVKFKGNDVELIGEPIKVGDQLPDFYLLDKDLEKVSKDDLLGKTLLISVVPDLNTPVCSIQTQKFNQETKKFPDVNFITVSTNTNVDQENWCETKNVKNIPIFSDHDLDFGKKTKLLIPSANIDARAVLIMDHTGKVIYEEILKNVHSEPDYEAALNFIKKL